MGLQKGRVSQRKVQSLQGSQSHSTGIKKLCMFCWQVEQAQVRYFGMGTNRCGITRANDLPSSGVLKCIILSHFIFKAILSVRSQRRKMGPEDPNSQSYFTSALDLNSWSNTFNFTVSQRKQESRTCRAGDMPGTGRGRKLEVTGVYFPILLFVMSGM